MCLCDSAARRAAIVNNPQKVEELFITWNESSSSDDRGMNRSEFRHAVQMLGLQAPVAEVNELFKNIDTNHDGTLSYGELKSAIARRNPELQAKREQRRRRVEKEKVCCHLDHPATRPPPPPSRNAHAFLHAHATSQLEIADTSSLRTLLRKEVERAEETWNNLPEDERAAYQKQMDLDAQRERDGVS